MRFQNHLKNFVKSRQVVAENAQIVIFAAISDIRTFI